MGLGISEPPCIGMEDTEEAMGSEEGERLAGIGGMGEGAVGRTP